MVAAGTSSRRSSNRFPAEFAEQEIDAGDVAARAIERCNEAQSDRISRNHEDNGNGGATAT